VHVHVVDPSAYTPPYDHALCRALGSAGADVDLYTSRFAYGPVAPAEGYARRDFFYRASPGSAGSRIRRAAKLAQHVPDMLRYRAAARRADVVHFQWLAVQHLDGYLLPTKRPLVLTAHDILPREPRPGQRSAQRRLYDRFDAVVVHSEHGRVRLTEELGLDPARVHVIPHGVLRPWEDIPEPDGPEGGGNGAVALPVELRGIEGQVALFFGLLRPYKGLDILLDAWRQSGLGSPGDRELWIVGMPRMDIAPLRAAAPPGVRFLPRFVYGKEILAVMRRADLVVLPYREIDQSGVVFTALGAGVPLLLSDVGGFPDVAATGAARTVRAGDPAALGEALSELFGDPTALAAMTERSRAAVAQEYAWERIAERTIALYDSLLENVPR
jgi:glycosyltransferase involved in cell wall biosynthesis